MGIPSFGQYCPILKAEDIILEKWSLLILRELFLGTSHFNDINRAIPRISPTLLTKRLRTLEKNNVVLRKRTSGQRNYEYFLTSLGKEIEPLIVQLSNWGLRWALSSLSDDESPIDYLMRKIQHNLNIEHLPQGETVIHFLFTDAMSYSKWWLWVSDNGVDLCSEDPGKDVDVYITTETQALFDIWNGRLDIQECIKKQMIKLTGENYLIKNIRQWLISKAPDDALVSNIHKTVSN